MKGATLAGKSALFRAWNPMPGIRAAQEAGCASRAFSCNARFAPSHESLARRTQKNIVFLKVLL